MATKKNPVLSDASLADATRALQSAADAITAAVPGTPRVTVVIQRLNGDARRRGALYGHTTTRKVWEDGDTGAASHEVALAAEYITRDPSEVLGTLLHEMAHAYNLANGIKDCDTNGRHNRRFQATAQDLFGLVITEAPGIGWSKTECPEDTVKRFAGAFSHTVKARRFRAAAPTAGAGKPKGRDKNLPLLVCGCGNKVRASRAVMLAGLRCLTCGKDYDIA